MSQLNYKSNCCTRLFSPMNRISHIARLTQRAWLILCVCVLSNSLLHGQTTDSFSTRPSSGRDPLTVLTQIPSNGVGAYSHADVTITCNAGPSQSDRNLTVVLFVKGYNEDSPFGFSIRKNIQLAEDATTATVRIPFVEPDYYSFDVAVYEAGREIEDKDATRRAKSATTGFVNSTRSHFALGAIVANRSIANNNSVRFSYSNLQARLNNTNTAATPPRVIARQDAPADWRSYMGLSMWIISAENLAEINASQPDVAEAIRDYLAAGGQIAIHNAGETLAMDAARTLLGPALDSAEWSTVTSPDKPWWTRSSRASNRNAANVPGSRGYGMGGYGGGGYGGVGYGAAGYGGAGYGVPGYGGGPNFIRLADGRTVVVNPNAPSNAATSQANGTSAKADEELQQIELKGAIFDAAIAGETWLSATLSAPLHLVEDTIAVLESGDPYFSLSGEQFGTQEWAGSLSGMRDGLMQKLAVDQVRTGKYLAGNIILLPRPPEQMAEQLGNTLPHRYTGALPTLVDATSDGNWFYRNLIGAVGKPPVWAFCAVVGLFGAVLGPGLLYFTARIGRRSLMILLVPAISMFATLSIIAYGVLHEGFDTHIRTVSVQWIDVSTERGFAWSRQNFFSGLPPRGGLNFGLETYARPVTVGDGQTSYSAQPRDSLDGSIVLSDKQVWLNWLKPRRQQQLLVGHPLRGSKFPMTFTQSKVGELLATNLTDQHIPIAVTRDTSGKYYFVRDLAAKGTATVVAEEQSTAVAKIARLIVDLKPSPPKELTAGGGSLLSFGTSNRWSSNTEEPDVINSAFATKMSDRIFLPTGSAVALVTETSNIEIPVDGKMDKSLHLIVGEHVW